MVSFGWWWAPAGGGLRLVVGFGGCGLRLVVGSGWGGVSFGGGPPLVVNSGWWWAGSGWLWVWLVVGSG